MRNVAFAIWMAGYALASNIAGLGPQPPSFDRGLALLNLVIWVGVGILLYEPRPNKDS
jgi:hypothetical protein